MMKKYVLKLIDREIADCERFIKGCEERIKSGKFPIQPNEKAILSFMKQKDLANKHKELFLKRNA